MADSEWSQAEIDASVLAYLGMLSSELRGDGYNKAETNRNLRSGVLESRSRGSVEMRMCNISQVLADRNETYIDDYKPRGNIGPRVYPMIESALDRESESSSTTPKVPPEKLQEIDALIRSLESLPDARLHSGDADRKRASTTGWLYAAQRGRSNQLRSLF
jgi:hypothetical protein